jgi:hypothetical protein
MAVSHLVRRGVEAISTLKEAGDVPTIELEMGPAWLVSLLVITVLALFFALFAVSPACSSYPHSLLTAFPLD